LLPYWAVLDDKTARVKFKTSHTQVQNGPSPKRKLPKQPKTKMNF